MRNKVDLIGRVGKDPETRHLDGGKSVTTFSIATTESWKDQNGNKQEHTEWHNCVCWGKLGEVIGKYVKKGHMFGVQGKIRQRSYDATDGTKRYVTEIIVDDILLLPNGDRQQSPRQSAPPPSGGDAPTRVDKVSEDDLPF